MKLNSCVKAHSCLSVHRFPNRCEKQNFLLRVAGFIIMFGPTHRASARKVYWENLAQRIEQDIIETLRSDGALMNP
jgi:hypothetical protein